MKQAEVVGGLLAPADQDGAKAMQPGVGPLNGLITNDKFCLTRTGRLQLNLSRVRSEPRASKFPQLFGEAGDVPLDVANLSWALLP